MTELRNPTSEKAGDVVVLAVLGVAALLGIQQAQAPGTALYKLFHPGKPSTGTTTSPGQPNPVPSTAPQTGSSSSCPGYDQLITAADIGGNTALTNWVGKSWRSLYNATYPDSTGGRAYAMFISDGHHC